MKESGRPASTDDRRRDPSDGDEDDDDDDDGMRTRVDVETMRATRNGAARVAAREARLAHRGDDDEDDDAVVSAFVAKEAMDAHAERIRGALARARGYDRGRRGGGVAYDPRDRPTCVITDVKSALRALVPGEAFYAPRRAVERFTVGAANGETRARQLVAYARSIDRGLGLEGWDETSGEDPATAFRDGAASVVDGGGAPARMDTGLVVFTGDASHFTVAQDLEVLGAAGEPGAYQRGRAAVYGGVGTLCQWMFRNQNGHPTRRANAEDDAFTRTCGADDPDVVEFRAVSLVWCGFPADFNFRESTNRADAHRSNEPTRLTPPAWLDTDVCSGLDVYSLGVETISESRIRDARKLMSKIMEALRLRDADGNRDGDDGDDDAWRGLSWDEIEETLPRGARHPTKFSFWIMHFVPCCALDDNFRWLLLSTDDTVLRLSLILERIKLEKFFWRGAHVPVVHECGHVLTETRMARPLASHAFGSYGRSRAHEDEGGEKFPSSVITRVLFNPTGFYSRYCVFASDPPKSTDVEESLRDVWARYEDFLGRSSLDYTTNVYVENDVSYGDYSWFKGYKWCPVTCPRCECSCGFRFSRDDNPLSGASRSPLREWPRRHAPRSLDRVAFYVFFYIAPYWGAATGEGMTDAIVPHFLHGDTEGNIIFDECDGDFAEKLRIRWFHPCVNFESDDDDDDDDEDDESDDSDDRHDDGDGDDDGDANTRSDSDSVEFDD